MSDGYDGSDARLSEHFVEAAQRLRRIVIAVLAASVILSALPADTQSYVPLISKLPYLIVGHTLPDRVVWRGRVIEVHIAQYSPFGGVNVIFKTALLLGVLGASPVIAREVYAYVAPGLYPHERRLLKRIAVVGTALFALGVVVALYVVIPVAFKFMIIATAAITGEDKLVAFSDVEQLFNAILLMAVALGLAFEAPLVAYLLAYMGVLTPEHLRGDNKKYLAVASFALGAVVSPDPSGLGMILVGLTMYASILAAVKLGYRGGRRAEARVEARDEEVVEKLVAG